MVSIEHLSEKNFVYNKCQVVASNLSTFSHILLKPVLHNGQYSTISI